MKINSLRLVTLVFLAILFCFCIQIVGLAYLFQEEFIMPDSFVPEKPFASNIPEISFADGVTISPNVHPVIIISGSDYEMGYQWYQQMIGIFGPWILTPYQIDRGFFWRGHDFTEEELKALKAYQMYLSQYAPEMIDMFKGMADGATDAGVPLTYTEVLAQWTKAEIFPSQPIPLESEKETIEDHCSGFAAWGSATSDGKLVCAQSMDGETNYEMTIMAFPEGGGNNFIYSPFNPPEGCNEGRAKGGPPALNDQGLVFIREADVPSKKEGDWTYGITPNVAAIHTIRFANNAKEALEMILDYPSGDGYNCGFWVDTSGDHFVDLLSYDPVVFRKAGDLEEVDFLFVTNNTLAPIKGEFQEAVTGAGATFGTMFVKHAGWAGPGTENFSSISRNLQFWNMLNYYSGHIDKEFAKMMYRFSDDPNPGSPVLDPGLGSATADDYAVFEKADLKKTIGGVHNTKVTVILPEELEVYICQGYPGRKPHPPIEETGYPIDPLHAFYQLKLEPSISEVIQAALDQATYELIRADGELMKLNYSNPAFVPLKELFEKATIERRKGSYYQFLAKITEGNDSVYNWGKALRSYTRCQAYAQHVFESLVSPPDTPEDLFLKPWGYWVETIR